jgi:ferredoxin
MVFLLILLPLLVILFGWTGGMLDKTLAGTNSKVRLVRLLQSVQEDKAMPELPEITAFRSSGVTLEELKAEVASIEHNFGVGSRIYGGFIGLVFGLTLIGLVRTPYRTDYVPNRGSCYSCGKCMDYCPVFKEVTE